MPKTIELFLSAKTQTLLEVNFYFSVSEVGHLESKISLISAGVIVRMTCENSINNINIGIYLTTPRSFNGIEYFRSEELTLFPGRVHSTT